MIFCDRKSQNQFFSNFFITKSPRVSERPKSPGLLGLRIFDGLRKIKNLIQGVFLFPSHGLTFYGIGWSVSLRKHIDSRCGIWKNQSSSVHYWLILSVLSENSRTTKEGRTKAGKEKKKKLTTPIILRPSKLVIITCKYRKKVVLDPIRI